MDYEINLSRFKDITDNIIRIDNDYTSNSLKLHYKTDPVNSRGIMQIIRYLNNTDWKNFKFNEYSIQKNHENYIIILNYVAPKAVFSK